MGIDLGRLNDAAVRARKMIQEDAKRDSHIIKERMKDRANSKFYSDQPMDTYSRIGSITSSAPSTTMNEDVSDDKMFADMDAKMNEYKARRSTARQQAPIVHNVGSSSASKLPKEILEAFAKDPSALTTNESMGLSVMDYMPISKEVERERDVITEAVQQPTQQPQRSLGIDYELVKGIVEGAVKKYVGAYTKKLISEGKQNDGSTLKGIQLKGDKFVFITESGDVYEAKLEYKKNINEKKKA